MSQGWNQIARKFLACGLLALVCVTAGVSKLLGQAVSRSIAGLRERSNATAASPSGGDWKAWISLGFVDPRASAPELNPRNRAAGANLAIWGTYKFAALSVRTTAIPATTDMTSGINDQAALLGVHVPLRPHEDVVLALGGGQSFGVGSVVALHREAMFEGAAQFNLNYRFIGLGIDAVIGSGKTRRYAGAGLSLSFGRFR